MSTKNIKILLVDDHTVVRLGIRSLIEKSHGMLVCGEAETLKETYQKLTDFNPDIVLLDIKLPDGSGIGGCKKIKKISPKTKVIILTAYAENHIIMDSIKAGADGYLLKNVDSKTIITAIEDVVKGKSVLDHSVTDIVFNQVKGFNKNIYSNLAIQEQEILEYICQGKTNREIGAYLYISEKTVRNYVSKIMSKINVVNRTEAAAYWSEQKSLR
jgi:DNA-binding NarL/FixJ family response regulator